MILFHTSQTVALSSAVEVTAQFSVNYTHRLYSNTKSSYVVSQDGITNPTTGKNPYLAPEAIDSLDRDQYSQARELTFVLF